MHVLTESKIVYFFLFLFFFCIFLKFQVWLKVIEAVPLHYLQQSVNWHAPTWFRLLIQPPNIPIDYSLLTYENSKVKLLAKCFKINKLIIVI